MKNLPTFEEFLNESVVIPDLTKDREFLKFVEKEVGSHAAKIEKQEHLNDGYSVFVAKYLQKKYPNSEIWTIGNPMVYHAAIKIGDLYYDGVNTKGVKNLKDLEWAKDLKSPLNPQKGIKYED